MFRESLVKADPIILTTMCSFYNYLLLLINHLLVERHVYFYM